MDGREVFNALQQKDPLIGSKKNIRIWEISLDKDKDQPTENFADYGQKINVYNVNIGQEIPEYLVNFEYFNNTAKQFGLEPIGSEEFPNLRGIQSFEDVYDKIISLNPTQAKLIGEMTEDEKFYSFMNNYFIFRKVSSPSKAAIITETAQDPLTDIVEPVEEIPNIVGLASKTKIGIKLNIPPKKPGVILKKPIIKKKET